DAFLGSIGSPDHPPNGGRPSALRHMPGGFAYRTSYNLGPRQPSHGPATFLRHTCYHAYLLRTQVPPSAQHPHPKVKEGHQEVSLIRLDRDGSSPVREYQPVVHRLRLSASP